VFCRNRYYAPTPTGDEIANTADTDVAGELAKEAQMSLRVNTNVEAFNAHRNLEATQMKLSQSMQKLSSGLRINSAADDAAGLAISEKMRSQITGTAQAQRNAMDGISLVQTAEGAYNEMHSILQRVRELSVQAQNSTLSTSDLVAIDQEVGQLTAELTRISGNTQFNGLQVLSGSFTLQVGADSGSGNQIAFSLTAITFTGIGSAASAGAISAIDQAITSVSSARSTLGAIQNRLEHAVSNLGVYQENITAAESRIRDVDIAAETVNFTKLQILSQSGIAMLAQANSAPNNVLSLLRG
jgi:flagellin